MQENAKTAYLFPGQGAQHVGMGHDLYEAYPVARNLFDLAEQATELPLKRLCFEGPQEELSRTDVAQPAIFTVSAAALAVLGEVFSRSGAAAPNPDCVAGLSLGEYTALHAAGAVEFEDALRLVVKRGRAMQEAATSRPGGMVSVLGIEDDRAAELSEAAAGGQVLVCANFNCPGQVVLSGEREACERAAEMAAEFGASGAVPLDVAGAFHSPLMAPAAEQLREAVDSTAFRPPRMPVVANATAEPYDDPDLAAPLLLRQLTSSVRWRQSMEWLLAAGVERFYEIGPGRVLAGLMRRIDRKTRVKCLNTRTAIEELAGTEDAARTEG